MKTTIGASIICMDHNNFEYHVELANKISVDYLHVDVMDGMFVPRYGIYPEVLEAMSSITDLKMDVHLMVSNPDFALSQFNHIKNIEFFSVHLDRQNVNILQTLDSIRQLGKKAVLVIDLSTDIRHVAQFVNLNLVDGLMFMGIHPGVLVQKKRPELVISKIQLLKELCDIDGLFVQCDGGVNVDTIPNLKAAGINNLVCGSSSLYKGVDFSANKKQITDMVTANKRILDKIIHDEL